MKTIFIISIFLVGIKTSVMCQNTVETPYGTSVDVWTQSDMIGWQRDTMDTRYATAYPDATFHPTLPDAPYDPSSSSKFNCHGYAWYMSWMGPTKEFDDPWNMTDTEAANYFNDPSFKSCAKADADIWWINGGTHSALATANTDELKSKWGVGPLATHGIEDDDSPYPITSVTYYKECYREVYGNYTSDDTLYHCKVNIFSVAVSNNVDLEIEYEDWLLIESDFSTGTGSTLYLHPE